MATVEVTITGDTANIIDEDWSAARVRLRANTDFIADRDGNKIRILDENFRAVAVDGTFSFSSVIASVDTIVAGTLQYYVDLKVRLAVQRSWKEVILGPYSLAGYADGVTVDLSDLETTQPTGLLRQLPDDINVDVLAASEAYTDDQIAVHEAAANPHSQYARMVDGALAATLGGRIIRVGAGGQFPAVVQNAILVYGGQ
jgi:hypothetical protein